MSNDALLLKLCSMQETLNSSAHLARLGALFSATILLQVDEDEFYLHFREGQLKVVETGPSRKIAWKVGLRTDAEALQAFWQTMPVAGYHDIFGLVKLGRAKIDGDILFLVKNLRYFKEFMALGRGETS